MASALSLVEKALYKCSPLLILSLSHPYYTCNYIIKNINIYIYIFPLIYFLLCNLFYKYIKIYLTFNAHVKNIEVFPEIEARIAQQFVKRSVPAADLTITPVEKTDQYTCWMSNTVIFINFIKVFFFENLK